MRRGRRCRCSIPGCSEGCAPLGGVGVHVGGAGEIAVELGEFAFEIGVEVVGAPEHPCGLEVGTGSAPETEVEATRIEPLDRAVLLGHQVRAVVGEHDAARAHADRGRVGERVQHEELRGARRDGLTVVVLGHPVPGEPESLGGSHHVDEVVVGLGVGLAGLEVHEVEDGVLHGDPFRRRV